MEKCAAIEDHGAEEGRVRRGHSALGMRPVRGAIGAHFAVAPVLASYPLQTVVAVVGVVHVLGKGPLRLVAPAVVLPHHNVAALHKVGGEVGGAPGLLVVRGALEENGERPINRFAVGGGAVYVGG